MPVLSIRHITHWLQQSRNLSCKLSKPWWFQTFQLLFTIWQSKYNFFWYFACRVLHKMLQSFHLFFKLFTPLLFVKLLLAYLIHFRFRRDSVFISPSKLTTANLRMYIFSRLWRKRKFIYQLNIVTKCSLLRPTHLFETKF